MSQQQTMQNIADSWKTRATTSARKDVESGSLHGTAALGVLTALEHGMSATIQLAGDSTGDATDEWFSLLGQHLGQSYDATVVWRKWDDIAQNYGPRTILRTGTAGERYANLAAASLQYSASAAITGDLDVVAKIRPTTWSALQVIAARYDSTGNQRGWQMALSASGRITFIWSADGTVATTINSTIPVPFTDGQDGWVRVSFDVDNGATGSTATFATSTDGITWTTLGTPVVTAGITSLFASTAPYQVGSYSAAITSPFTGRVYWVEIRSGIDGRTVVPPLLGDWEQASSSLTNTILFSGAPTLVLLCGSQSGQGISYLDNATRRPKVFTPYGQKLIILSTGQNDSGANATYIAAYSAWVTNIKALLPNVPILCLTQNPTSAPMSDGAIAIRAARGVALMTWVPSQVGLYGLDTYRAFDRLDMELNTDGLHPNSAGSALWAAYLYSQLFEAR